VKKLSQRVAGLTSSITVGLILFAVALTALLAYRAYDAARAQEQLVEHTLRDYAGFAAFQLKNAAGFRMLSQNRQAMQLVMRHVIARGPTPPLGVERAATLIREKGGQCRCLDAVRFYYQVTLADSGIETTASDVATPADIRRIRDTVIAHALALGRGGLLPPPPPGSAPLAAGLSTQHFIFSQLGGRPYVFAHTLTPDTLGTLVVAYGYAVPAERFVGDVVRWVLRNEPVLPTTLTRGLDLDSLLAVRVSDPSGAVVYASKAAVDTRYAAVEWLDEPSHRLRYEVSIHPALAGRLIIGGLPRSRLPEVLATAFVAVSLLGLLLYQFRRQEELGRLRDDFVSGVSHELRTPLAQIRLLAELLRLGRVATEEKRVRSLSIIDQEARRLSFLVDSILSFTHPKPGRLSPVSTDVAVEIDEIVSGFEPLAQARGVRLVTQLERGIVANVDRGALRQVLLNVLDNAVRYGPPRQSVTITTRSAGDDWTLEVSDEGPGIPANERERIFAPYYRMKRDAGGAVGGTGIGLAVVRRLVEEHGGRVHVVPAHGVPIHGDDGVGARFVVTLPIDAPGVSGR
jgi:signal transduction histidine kinase